MTYLRRLKELQPSALLVVAPSRRFEELWTKLTRRVSKTDEIALGDTRADPEVRLAPAGTDRWLAMVSWRTLLDHLASRVNGAGDTQAANDIQQLQGLANQQDSEAFLPLRPEQLGPETPRFIGHLVRLVDDATRRIFQTDWAESGSVIIRSRGTQPTARWKPNNTVIYQVPRSITQ